MVNVIGWVDWTAHTGTGTLQIGGLPFTTSGTAGTYSPATIWVDRALTLTASNIAQGIAAINNTYISIAQYPLGGGTYSMVNMDTDAGLIFNLTYYV